MRNLKRVLSLVMAVAMLIGLMVVSASAASTYDNFTDKDEIVNKEAVNTMVSLGVINGKEDGSYFDPTGIVTRAEMAKLIAVTLNGGKDPLLGTGAVTTQFSDVASNYWAAPYIAYCANLGIINGRGDGTFGPEEPVTGTAAAKMMLTALGYRADIEGLTGTGWDLNTDSLANKVGLYDDMSIVPSNGLSRDNTAQLIYNGVQADEVEYRNNYGEYSGVIYAQPVNGTGANAEPSTLLYTRFNVVKVEGVVVANDVMAIDDQGTTVAGKTRLTDIYVGGTHRVETVNNQEKLLSEIYPVAMDNSYLGQRVVLYVKGLKNLAPNAASTQVVSEPIISADNTVATTANRLKDTDAVRSFLSDNGLSLPASGVAFSAVNGTVFYSKNETQINASALDRSFAVTSTANVNGTELTFIDHDGDGVVNYIFKTIPTMAKVTAYNEKDETLTLAGEGTLDFKDVATYKNVAKDDIVLYYLMNDTYYLTKAETVSGKVVSYDNNNKTVTIDGTAYGKSTAGLTLASTDLTAFDASEEFINNTYTFYLDAHGNVVGWVLGEETLGNYALILGSEGKTSGNNSIMNTGKVKLLLADGTTATYDVNLLASANRLGVAGNSNSVKEQNLATALSNGSYDNRLVTYSVGDDKTVTLTDPSLVVGSNYNKMIDSAENGGMANVTAPTAGNDPVRRSNADYTFTGTNGGTVTVNDSTIFFINDGTDYSVVVGVSNLPLDAMGSTKATANDNSAQLKSVIYTVTTANKNIAKAVWVDGYYAGTKNFVYVSKDYTAAQPLSTGETIYTYPVVFADGETGTIQVKGTQATDEVNSTQAPITKGTVYEYIMNGNYAELYLSTDTVNGMVTTWARGNAINVLPGVNGGVNSMSQATAYTVASDAKLWNVEDTSNVNAETLTVNMSVAFALNSDGLISAAFVRETNVEFRQIQNKVGAQLTVNGQAVANGGSIYVANGFTAKVEGTANGTVVYDIFYDNGTSDLNQSETIKAQNNGNPVASISVPANSRVEIKSVTGVLAGSAAPTITSVTPAASLDGTAGGEVATVAATTGNGTLTYEWFKADDASKTNPVSLKDNAGYEGATSATLSAKAGTLANGTEVFFFCKVTNTETGKGGTTVDSNVVSLTPAAAPQTLTLTFPNAGYPNAKVWVNDKPVTIEAGRSESTVSFQTGDTVVIEESSLTASTVYEVAAGVVKSTDASKGITFTAAETTANITLIAPVEQVIIHLNGIEATYDNGDTAIVDNGNTYINKGTTVTLAGVTNAISVNNGTDKTAASKYTATAINAETWFYEAFQIAAQTNASAATFATDEGMSNGITAGTTFVAKDTTVYIRASAADKAITATGTDAPALTEVKTDSGSQFIYSFVITADVAADAFTQAI